MVEDLHNIRLGLTGMSDDDSGLSNEDLEDDLKDDDEDDGDDDEDDGLSE